MNRVRHMNALVAVGVLAVAVLLLGAPPLQAATPSGTMQLNGGAAYATSQYVTVNSAVTGAAKMRFGTLQGSVWTYTAWRSYQPTSTMYLPAPDGRKIVIGHYADGAGNVFRSPYVYITLDRVPPSGTMKLNGGAAYTNSKYVTMNSAVTGATRMRFGTLEGNVWTYSAWRSYAAASTVYLPAPDGKKTCIAHYVDAAGNVFRSAYVTILLDTIAPTVRSMYSSTHTNPTTWYDNNVSHWSWTPRADASGIAGYSFLVDKAAGTIPDKTIDPTPMGPAQWTSGVLADGQWVFHVRARDHAGNWGAASGQILRVDTVPPVTKQTGADDAWHTRAVTVSLSAKDAGSGVKTTQYQVDGHPSVAGDKVTIPARYTGSRDTHQIRYQSIDNMGFSEDWKTCLVKIDGRDTTAPSVQKPAARQRVIAKRGAKKTITLRVADPQITCGKANVTIKIVRSNKTVARQYKTLVRVNRDASFTFRCTLPKGANGQPGYYGLWVIARDLAGNSVKSVRKAFLEVH